MGKRHDLKRLAWREYLPMAATIATWALILAAIGHADAARLFAAALSIRAIQLLTKISTVPALRRRLEAPVAVQRQARWLALGLQGAALAVAAALVALLVMALTAIGQQQIAAFLPFIAVGMPARYLRLADAKTASPYYRLALATGGLAMVLIGWASGWHAAALGLMFGAREWIAYAVLRLWPRASRPAKVRLDDMLKFGEVAHYSAVLGRRLLTYRITKSLLAVFGPFGTAAARTGRGLNWHAKVEPYIPHSLAGFLLFSAVAFGIAAILATRSGEPALMIVAAGLLQVGAAAANVILFWRYLSVRNNERAPEDDFEE
ncbi:MAG TPA: hypothetical protein VNA29_09265 [Sphingomicrobium sp.]|nr:hypothetical protein [Sphingomicrobium sp.]